MSTLHIQYPGGAKTLETDDEVSVGRAGTIALGLGKGREDPYLSAINHVVAVRPYHYEITVAFDKAPVTVFPLPEPGSRHDPDYQELTEGQTGCFYWHCAEAVVHTVNTRHVIRLLFSADERPSERARYAETAQAYPIDLSDRKDRLLVVLCRDRLKRMGAKAIPYEEACAILARAGRPEDQTLKAGTARNVVELLDTIEFQLGRPVVIERPGEVSETRMTKAVDWLVSMKAVNASHYRAVAYPPGVPNDDPFFAE